MFAQDAPAGGLADGEPLRVADLAQITERVLGRGCDQDLAVDFEDGVEAFPPVADHRGGAGPRFEQAHAG